MNPFYIKSVSQYNTKQSIEHHSLYKDIASDYNFSSKSFIICTRAGPGCALFQSYKGCGRRRIHRVCLESESSYLQLRNTQEMKISSNCGSLHLFYIFTAGCQIWELIIYDSVKLISPTKDNFSTYCFPMINVYTYILRILICRRGGQFSPVATNSFFQLVQRLWAS